ncbi:MAG TPA: HlyD family efflux transporter periplasmic adaptor subunit [Fontimonas sp.]
MNAPQAPAANAKRQRGLLTLTAVVAAGILGWSAYWFLHARHFEHTDDAYVASDLVQITSEQAGTVTAIHVDDTQRVERGQVLLELDRADAEVAMAEAEAALAQAVRGVRGMQGQVATLQAQLEQREVALATARANLKRRQSIAGDGAVSAEELAHAADEVSSLQAALNATREQLATAQAQIDGTTVQSHPQVLQAVARLREAALALQRTRLIAPVSGVVAKRGVQLGARIAPGTPLMAVVPLDQVWVDANFKEVQLQHMKVGQPVELHADLYGNDIEYRGHIAGVSAGSGSAFALLPAQNASGNWIKVVQRVPTRIVLDPEQLKAHPLRVGLSMSARVDLRASADEMPALRAEPQRVQTAAADTALDERIASIIAANAGTASF